MDSMPIISVCMLTYNHEKFICRAIESVMSQKISIPFEVLISDDASTDRTCDIIREKYGDKVELYQNEYNRGISYNLYSVLKRAKGKYIAMLSGDDWWNTDSYLSKLYQEILKHSDCICVSPYVSIYDKDKRLIDTITYSVNKVDLKDFLHANPCGIIYGLIKNIFDNENDEWLYYANPKNEEIPFQLFLFMHGSVYYYPECIYAYQYVSEGGSNYNSKHDIIDTYIEAVKACEVLSERYENHYNFSRLLGKYEDALVQNYLVSVKRKNSAFIKKYNMAVPIYNRVMFLFKYFMKRISKINKSILKKR